MLNQLQEVQRNKQVLIKEANHLNQSMFTVSSNAVYYPYNSDVGDVGWGCAWRAIQTLLSNHNIRISFSQLYSTFSKKTLLLQIARELEHFQGAMGCLEKSKWAPEELDNHWAEPFIGSLICWFHKLPNQLLLLNGYPQAYAPKQAFQRVINFPEMVQIIKSKIKNSTIMIDDGRYALSIVGWRQISLEEIQFLFADPHINCNREKKEVGLYRKVFDLKGRFRGNDTRNQHQIKEALYNVYEHLEFQTKAWMLCVIIS